MMRDAHCTAGMLPRLVKFIISIAASSACISEPVRLSVSS